MRILCICDNLLPPYVQTSGTKAIFQLHQSFAERGHETHYLTSKGAWTSPHWEKWACEQKGRPQFFALPDRFNAQRLAYLPYALMLQQKHGYDVIHEYSSSPLVANRSGLLGRLTGAKVFHTVCTWNRPFLRSKRWNLLAPDALFQSAPLPIDSRFFEGRARPVTESFLYLGLLNKNKGAGIFLEAIPAILEENPRARGVIVTAPHRQESRGNNPYRKKVQRLLDRYPGRVNFIEEELDIAKLLPHIRVVVYPAETLFGTLDKPSVLMEAMAAAKGIVATRLPELDGLLSENQNALLFESGETTELVDKVGRLLRDDALCFSMGASARQAVESYRAEKAVDWLERQYKKSQDSSFAGDYAGETP